MPVPDWWSQLATRAAESAKITHVEIARRVERITGELPSASTISRCLSGEITTVELMAAVSSILRIPPAVFVASSRAEAVALQREQLAVSILADGSLHERNRTRRCGHHVGRA